MNLWKKLRSNFCKRFVALKAPCEDDETPLRYRSFGSYKADKPDNLPQEDLPTESNEGKTSTCFEGSRTRSDSFEEDLKPESSQHIEVSGEYVPLGSIADKLCNSGLCFESAPRKKFDCHSFEFLCWLPEAVKNLGRRQGENSEKGGKDGKDENIEKEPKDDPRDEGVCIVRVVPRQPGDDLEKTMQEDDRQLYELTYSEWKIIQRQRQAVGQAPTNNGTPLDAKIEEQKWRTI